MTLIDLEESVTCQPWMRWSAILFGAVVIWLLAWPIFGEDVTRAIKGPPVIYHGVSVLPTGAAAPGSTVRVRFDITRRYDCPAQIVRWWLDAEGNRLSELPLKTGGYSALGRRWLVVTLTVPQMAAGRSRIGYRVKVIHDGPGCAPGFVGDPPVAWIPIRGAGT